MAEWKLVPVWPEWTREHMNTLGRDTIGDPRPLYRAMLAATPPMPRAEWDAMVERAARAAQALLESRWEDLDLGEQDDAQRMAEAALRAALPGLKVEGE